MRAGKKTLNDKGSKRGFLPLHCSAYKKAALLYRGGPGKGNRGVYSTGSAIFLNCSSES
jgi:hypothetical protein